MGRPVRNLVSDGEANATGIATRAAWARPWRIELSSEPLMPPRRKTSPAQPKPGAAGPRSTGRLQRALDATAKREIEAALKESGGNVVKAARALGIANLPCTSRLRSLCINPALFRP